MAQEVAFAGHHVADAVNGEGSRPHIDRRQGLENGAQHVVVNQIRLQRYRHQAGLHAAGLGDEVATRLRRQRHTQRFFVTRLRIRNFAVSGTGNGGIGQIKVPGHLNAGRCQRGLLTSATGHAARAQVGDHGTGAKHQPRLRVGQPAHHHAGQGFGGGLGDAAGHGDGAGRAHLAEGVDHGRDAHLHGLEQDLTSGRIKTKGRHDMVDVE